MKRVAFRIAIALLAMGGCAPAISTSRVADLKVGDCFDLPSASAELNGARDVRNYPCSAPHEAELIFTTKYDGTGEYPGNEAFINVAKQACPAAYLAYMSPDFAADPHYSWVVLYPFATSWSTGDRIINCVVIRVDSQWIPGSVRAAK